MTTRHWNIRLFNPAEATQAEWQSLNQLHNELQAESLPDDPPIPLEFTINLYNSYPPVVIWRAWLAWNPDAADGGPALWGMARIEMLEIDGHRHVAQLIVWVHPEARRNGLGAQLLEKAVQFAQENGRRLVMIETNSNAPAGALCMQRLGAKRGLETHVNQLDLADLDRSLIETWIARAPERAAGYELGFWDGPYPDEDIEQVAAVTQAMNDQPHDNLEINDIQFTPDLLRQQEANMFQRGFVRWTFFVRQRATGDLAGFTDTVWVPSKAAILIQVNTGVLNTHRNLGLGRWLKAAMLLKVLEERPQVRFVRTQNADSNAPMLKINQELGFKPYRSSCIWQIETEKVLAYLSVPVALIA